MQRLLKKRSTLLIVLSTIVLTLIVVFAVLNFTASEKKIEQQLSRSYAIDDPQFSRTMGLLLGPPSSMAIDFRFW
jgi:cardiolipin synthase